MTRWTRESVLEALRGAQANDYYPACLAAFGERGQMFAIGAWTRGLTYGERHKWRKNGVSLGIAEGELDAIAGALNEARVSAPEAPEPSPKVDPYQAKARARILGAVDALGEVHYHTSSPLDEVIEMAEKRFADVEAKLAERAERLLELRAAIDEAKAPKGA